MTPGSVGRTASITRANYPVAKYPSLASGQVYPVANYPSLVSDQVYPVAKFIMWPSVSCGQVYPMAIPHSL